MSSYSYESKESTRSSNWFQVSVLLVVLIISAFILFGRGAYVSKEGGFKVNYFGPPHTDTQIINDYRFNNVSAYFISEHTVTSYHCHVMYFDLPASFGQSYGSQGLIDIAQSYLIRPSYQVTEKQIVLAGYEGRELYIDTPGEGIAICRMYVKGNRLYQCLISNKDKTKMSNPKVIRFLDSFQIIP